MEQKTFMKKGNIFLFLFLLSFFISLVSAQQPPSVQTNININTGLQIEFTQIQVFENSRDHIFNIHVFNISTGLKVGNDTTDCTFHLFDNTGFHVINQLEMPFDSEGIDWDLTITGLNFTRNGEYSSLVVCNTTLLGGFASVGFNVTPTGFGDLFDFYIIILLISAVLIIWGFMIKDPWVIIFGSFGLTFVGLYIMINGIVGIKDLVTTWAIALILLATAAYLSIRAAQEVING
ncbi:hypothetical protein LCGC14_3004780 [marine sediment metagenome]|uniref:Uncharacterized protein n=1 Tax=marine sediment metagenome TaxID=412755 RepID=A0A0F8X0I1_9ZZZZ